MAKPTRPLALILAVAIVLALTFSASACSTGSDEASFPKKEITYIIGWPQGSTSDSIGRALLEATRPHLNNVAMTPKFVVGGGSIAAAAELARAKPDGYTVAQLQNGPLTVGPQMEAVPYKVPDDFEIISMVFQRPVVWVVPANGPYKSLSDIVTEAKKKPGQITFSYSGIGTYGHLAMEAVCAKLGIKMKIVPFPSTTEGITSALGGHVETSLAHPPNVIDHVNEGRMIPIAAFGEFTGRDKIKGLKTFKEQGVYFEGTSWSVNALPKGTPKAIVQKLHDAFKKGIESDSYKAYTTKTMEPADYRTAEETLKVLKAEYEMIGKVVKDLNLKQ